MFRATLKIFLLAMILVSSHCRKTNSAADDPTDQTKAIDVGNPPKPGKVADLTALAMGSLPSIHSAGQKNPTELNLINFRLLEETNVTPDEVGAPVFDSRIQRLFRFECYWPSNADNYCPPAIKQKLADGTLPTSSVGGAKGPYQFSNGAIIGIIHHSRTYLHGAYEYPENYINIDSSRVQLKVLHGESAPLPKEKDGSQFFLPMNISYDFYTEFGGTEYLVSHSAYGKTFNVLALPGVAPAAQAHKGNNSFQQSYLAINNDGAPRVHGFHDVKTYAQRTLLLINFTSGRFILKMRTGDDMLVVAGQGGFDMETFTWKEGYYYAKATKTGNGVWQACVDNKTQLVLAFDLGPNACAPVNGYFEQNTNFELSDFLELTKEEAQHLAAFIAILKEPSFFRDAEVPAADASSFEQIPDTIEFQTLD